MPKTLLAVDDSVTMRKVLEIAFSGEEFNVITAEGRDDALGKMSEKPSVVLIDGGEDWGYALAKDVRAQAPGATILMMSSRFSPYDAAKAKESGADDNLEKPFESNAAVDKVKKAMAAHEGGGDVAAAAAPAPAPKAAPVAAAAPAPAPKAAAAAPAPAKAAEAPKPAAAAAPAKAAAAPAATNGKAMAGKLADLGLTPQQVEAVMALSRQAVEEVIWEVVPVLAATMIREEITRLTKE